jgi:DNA processing protein
MVGSRNASAQGLDNARAFASHLSRGGLTIVSGLALGIDGAAHEGALEGGGSTIGVVGTGLDVIYPRRHARLWQRVAHEGLILSEFAPGTPPLQANFPRRNRVIAGLTLGTLVVEAAMQSGSLITARLALEAGREVLAIPGSIHSPQARGCLHLIQQGAKLVTSAEDILQELPAWARPASDSQQVPPAGATRPDVAPDSDPFWRALGHDPVSLDTLVDRSGWPAHELQARLLTLELDGEVARLPGGLFQRRALG